MQAPNSNGSSRTRFASSSSPSRRQKSLKSRSPSPRRPRKKESPPWHKLTERKKRIIEPVTKPPSIRIQKGGYAEYLTRSNQWMPLGTRSPERVKKRRKVSAPKLRRR